MQNNLHALILSSKQHLESIFDSITDPILVLARDHTIQRLNQAAANMIGEDYRHILGQPCYAKIHGKAGRCENCPHAAIYENKIRGSMAMKKTLDGVEHIFDVRFFPLIDKQGQVTAVVEHYVDVTEGERAKEKLEAFYRQVKTELHIAKTIQESLLPAEVPAIPGLSVEVHYQAMEEIGGDLYDFINIDNENWGIVIGDVSGHGIPASLMGAMAKMSLFNHTPHNLSPMDVFEKVNRDLFNNLMMEYYISGIYVIYNTLNNTLSFSRAGHPEALLLRAATGEIEKLHTRGYFLGIMANGDFEEKSCRLKKGDRLFLYTDGLVEVQNKEGQKFGLDRLRRVLRENRPETLAKLKQNIINEVNQFNDHAGWEDDTTFILVEVTHSGCVERFRLRSHFQSEEDIHIFHAPHPSDYMTGVTRILSAMRKKWYPESDQQSVRLAVYDALDLFHRTDSGNPEGVYLAWQCGHEEVRALVVDRRFESEGTWDGLYLTQHGPAIVAISDRVSQMHFPDQGKKLLLVKRNTKY
ncbi:MAG: SpoIIE family protein phosphatase [Fibrobacterota bacterium]